MTESKAEKKYIRKLINYILLMIAITLTCLFVYKMANIYKTNKLSQSVLTEVVGSINYDDIESLTKEMTSDDFIILSFVKSEDTRKIEKNLKKIILDNDLQRNTYYLDMTDKMLEENYLDELNQKFKLSGSNKIDGLPTILYYRDGKFIKKITHANKGKTLDVLFEELLDEYLNGDIND